MPSTNPRIDVVCEKLLLESLELREDIALAKIADERAAGRREGDVVEFVDFSTDCIPSNSTKSTTSPCTVTVFP